MYITLAILVLSAVFFMNGRVRSDLVALCALLGLLVFQILTPEEALAGFANPIVIMMIGLFVVGGAIFQTGLAKMVSSRILGLAGNSELKLFILVMLVTAAIGAFISNTGTVALMLPIVVSLAANANMNVSRVLMPLAFASSMGGMLTLIGTAPNLVIQNVLTDAGYQPLTFFSFTPVGLVCILTGIIVLIPLSRWFLGPKKEKKQQRQTGKSLGELVREYQLADSLFRVRVSAGSPAGGQTVRELGIQQQYDLNLVEIRRIQSPQSHFLKSVSQQLADPDTTLRDGDILYLMGLFENVQRFAADCRLELMDTHTTEQRTEGKPGTLDFYDIGIAEILLPPTSRLVNTPVGESGLREQYDVNVLGIRRKNEYLLSGLKDTKMHSGDILLVQGAWHDISRLDGEPSEWVVLGQPLAEASRVTLDYKAPLAAAIMVLMIACMMFDFIPIAPVTAVMIAAVLMVLTGCLRNVEAAYKTINWESIVLIAAMLPMSVALEKTGASELLSRQLAQGLGSYGPVVLLCRRLFHHLVDDDVHQQHGHGRAARAGRSPRRRRDRGEPLSVPVRGRGGGEHVFRLAVLYAAQCAGHAGRTICVQRLHQSRPAVAGHYGDHNDPNTPAAVPVLTEIIKSDRPFYRDGRRFSTLTKKHDSA